MRCCCCVKLGEIFESLVLKSIHGCMHSSILYSVTSSGVTLNPTPYPRWCLGGLSVVGADG